MLFVEDFNSWLTCNNKTTVYREKGLIFMSKLSVDGYENITNRQKKTKIYV